MRKEKWSVTKSRIDRENIKKRTVEIEAIVNSSYSEWMRTVPRKAKKFLWKLKGYNFVDARDFMVVVEVVRANAHLDDEIHDAIMSTGFISPPNVTQLCQAYEMIAQYGSKAENSLRERQYKTFNSMHYCFRRDGE